MSKLTAACPDGIDVYFENDGGAIWQAVLPLLDTFARVPVSGLIAQYNGVGTGDGTDRLPTTMREILSKSLTLRGFINNECAAEHDPAFPREVGVGIADGRNAIVRISLRPGEGTGDVHRHAGGTATSAS